MTRFGISARRTSAALAPSGLGHGPRPCRARRGGLSSRSPRGDRPSQGVRGDAGSSRGCLRRPTRWVPPCVLATVERARAKADAVLVTPHWGPNMSPEPVGLVRVAADELAAAGATIVAGHSAHVFQGIRGRILFDVGDFLDDYAVDPVLHNDLGLSSWSPSTKKGPSGCRQCPRPRSLHHPARDRGRCGVDPSAIPLGVPLVRHRGRRGGGRLVVTYRS